MAALEPLMTPAEVAELLGVPRARLYQWKYEGRGPKVIKLEGKLLRYRRSDVERYVAECEDNATAAPR